MPFCTRLAALILTLIALTPLSAAHLASPVPPLTQQTAADDLSARLQLIIRRAEYAEARWGLLVVDARTGQSLCAHNADQLFVPASVNKLYFCAAALAEFGPDFRFETPVFQRGTLKDGRLEGDLILVASGDPTLGGRNDAAGHMVYRDDDHTYANSAGAHSELTDTDPLAGLKVLARQVAAAGVREIQGDVLVDDRLFDAAPGSGTGPDMLTPIMVNDNVVDVVAAPGDRPGAPARVRLRPETALFEVDNQLVTTAPGVPGRLQVVLEGRYRITVRGQMPVGGRPILRNVAVADPALFARFLFIEALRREGVTLKRTLEVALLPRRSDYARLPRLATFSSPPFAELIKVTLKTSSNVYANTLPLLLAARQGQTTYAQGLRQQERTLRALGVPLDKIGLATAAGALREDRLSPRAVVGLLVELKKRPAFEGYFAGLPVLGVDGTLADVISADSPARGQARGKTGTFYIPPRLDSRQGLLRAKALAGALTARSGREVVFALFVNDVALPAGVDSSREGRTLGRMCEIIWESL